MQEEHINKRFDSLETKFGSLEGRFGSLEGKFDVLEKIAKENQATLQDLIETINAYATKTDSDIADLKSDVNTIKTDISSVRSGMVTKDYLDDKLASLRGDSMILIRKEDAKLVATVNILTKRRALTPANKKQLLALEPFPQR